MKVGLLTHSTLPRGGVVHVLELGRSLLARGHDVTVFAPAVAGQTMFRATPCRLSLAELTPGAGDFAAAIRRRIDVMHAHLASALKTEAFDVLHAHDGIGANALADLVAAGRIGGYLRTVHHVDRFADARVQAWETRSIRAATRVLCVSAVWQQRLRTEHDVEAQQVGNGVDLERFTPQAEALDDTVPVRLGLRARGARVLAVGGIEVRKNTRRLLAAFVRLRQRRPDAQLIVAGGASLLPHDGEARAFGDEAAAAGLSIGAGEAIVLAGALPDALMPALYRSADVLAMPSLVEGFGLAALEALACGTPAVVSSLAPFTEHFGDGDVQWADPLQPDSIAAALERALQCGRHAAPPAVCARHSWARSAARHDAIYSDFIHSIGAAHARDALPAALAG
jgi:glycosyltransferase-like protein